MLNRRNVLAAWLVISVVFPVFASTLEKYDLNGFVATQNSNAPIVVHVHAPWCTTCQAQTPILEKLSRSDKYKDVKFYVVDFDTQKEALKKFNVTKQSVLIVLKGNKELGRSIGDTSQGSIEKLIDMTL